MPVIKFFHNGNEVTNDFICGEGDNAVVIPFGNLSIWDDETLNEHNVTKVVLPDPVTVISDRQFFQQLAIDGWISQDEALSAVMTGTIPSAFEDFINSRPLEMQFSAKMILAGATEFQRYHPLVAMVAQYMGLDDAAVDTFFYNASQL